MNDSVTFAPDDRRFVYAIAYRIVGATDDAEDVTQDALLLAYRHRDAFRGDSRYRTWLYRIALTTALGHVRRAKRARCTLAGDACERWTDPAASAESLLADAESAAELRRAVSELAPPYRDVLLARADAPDHEVARELGLSVTNVKVRAHRARKQLRARLDQLAA